MFKIGRCVSISCRISDSLPTTMHPCKSGSKEAPRADPDSTLFVVGRQLDLFVYASCTETDNRCMFWSILRYPCNLKNAMSCLLWSMCFILFNWDMVLYNSLSSCADLFS